MRQVEEIGMIPDFWLCCVSGENSNQQETNTPVISKSNKHYEANKAGTQNGSE